METRDGNDYVWSGNHVFAGTVSLPAQTVEDADVKTAANLSETKLQHRAHSTHRQKTGTDVVTQTEIVHIAYRGEVVLAVQITVDVKQTAGDKTVTVDVKKSTAGGAFATILTGVFTISTASTSKTTYNATLSGTPTLIAGDLLEVVATAAGSTGDQAQGLHVDVVTAENGT